MGKLIEKEGKFYKECGIVMLETTNVNNSLKGYLDKSLLFSYQKEYKTIPAEENFTGHFHLYITSDDEIKEGDRIYHIKDNYVDSQPAWYDHKILAGTWKKIIASTNQTLGLPQPSDKLIQAYIEAYNKGEKIEKVLVEYDEVIGKYSKSKDDTYFIPKLKDNKIIIKKVKDKLECNRSQLLKLVHDVADFIENKNSTEFNIDKWIEENL